MADRNRKDRIALVVVAGLLLSFAVARSAAAAVAEVAMFAWTTESSECDDYGLDDLISDAPEAWYDEMEDQGWTQIGRHVDGKLTPDWFCDHDVDGSTCKDRKSDGADAIMIEVHGLWGTDADGFSHWMGHATEESAGTAGCWINDSEATMHFGDLDLEYVHLISCESATDDIVPDLYRHFSDPVDTEDPDSAGYGHYLHLWTGFHGSGEESSRTDTYAKRFAEDAHDVSIADAWVDNFYDSSWSYTDEDGTVLEGENCPVAVSIDPSSSACASRLSHESYGESWSDPSGYAAWCATTIEDCNPIDDGPFDP